MLFLRLKLDTPGDYGNAGAAKARKRSLAAGPAKRIRSAPGIRPARQ
jgi:hypothetical protein